MSASRLLWIPALLLTPQLPTAAARAQTPQSIPVECQLDQGNWQPCRLTIDELGEHWWLQIGARRIDFHSDGRGSVTLSDRGGSTRSVQPVWTAQRALCWDGVCTKGDLPLD